MTGECPSCGNRCEVAWWGMVPVMVKHYTLPFSTCEGSGRTSVERRKWIVNRAAGQLLEWERAKRSPVPMKERHA